MKDWRPPITTNPDQCGGRPCIRGMRILVVDVLDLLAAAMSRFGKSCQTWKKMMYSSDDLSDPVLFI